MKKLMYCVRNSNQIKEIRNHIYNDSHNRVASQPNQIKQIEGHVPNASHSRVISRLNQIKQIKNYIAQSRHRVQYLYQIKKIEDHVLNASHSRVTSRLNQTKQIENRIADLIYKVGCRLNQIKNKGQCFMNALMICSKKVLYDTVFAVFVKTYYN